MAASHIIAKKVNYMKKICSYCCSEFDTPYSNKRQCSLKCFVFSRVIIPSDKTGCWAWTGNKNEHGYGLISVSRGRQIRAHRVMYEMIVGEIPNLHEVCHSCDRPSCVNPDHLFIGTHQDNMADMIKKGRGMASKKAMGERHHFSRLSNENVVAIRASSRPNKALAMEYGVSVWSIQNIRARRTWKHM